MQSMNSKDRVLDKYPDARADLQEAPATLNGGPSGEATLRLVDIMLSVQDQPRKMLGRRLASIQLKCVGHGTERASAS
jgi:hypothetical protein